MQEKKDIEVQRRVDEKTKDLMMELDRLQKIKYYEQQEKERKEQQMKDH